jgi:hypothetical protein
LLAAAFVIAASATALAAWHFLKPSGVVNEIGDGALRAAFAGDEAININASVASGDYIFTLPAVASGKDISDMPQYSNGELQSGRSYAVLAIQKTDGAAIDKQNPEAFFASPLIKGINPAMLNAMHMNGGYSEVVADDVLYRIVECDNAEMFADRGLYFAVCTGVFYDRDAFLWDERTGEVTANPDFDGASAVFDLPINPSRADPEKAARYLNDLLAPESDEAESPSPRETEAESPSLREAEAQRTDAQADKTVELRHTVATYTCERLKIPTASAVGQRKQVLPARVYVKSNARRYNAT